MKSVSLSVTTQMNATEQYCPVMFTVPYKEVLTLLKMKDDS